MRPSTSQQLSRWIPTASKSRAKYWTTCTPSFWRLDRRGGQPAPCRSTFAGDCCASSSASMPNNRSPTSRGSAGARELGCQPPGTRWRKSSAGAEIGSDRIACAKPTASALWAWPAARGKRQIIGNGGSCAERNRLRSPPRVPTRIPPRRPRGRRNLLRGGQTHRVRDSRRLPPRDKILGGMHYTARGVWRVTSPAQTCARALTPRARETRCTKNHCSPSAPWPVRPSVTAASSCA